MWGSFTGRWLSGDVRLMLTMQRRTELLILHTTSGIVRLKVIYTLRFCCSAPQKRNDDLCRHKHAVKPVG